MSRELADSAHTGEDETDVDLERLPQLIRAAKHGDMQAANALYEQLCGSTKATVVATLRNLCRLSHPGPFVDDAHQFVWERLWDQLLNKGDGGPL
ncbi:MAG TPA: hypothetical protein VNP97_05750, partial [Microbacterium sp.]|nr:hypothetical protein [Microbacterium sp.]